MLAVLNGMGWSYPLYSVPAGWTLLDVAVSNAGGNGRVFVYYKLAGASEPTSYTWTINPDYYFFGSGSIVAYSGVDSSYPINQHAASATASGVTSSATPTITPNVPNTMIVSWWGNLRPGNLTVTTPASDTLRAAPLDGTIERGAVSDQVQTSAVATSKTATFSAATSEGTGVGILALAPAGAAIPGPGNTALPSITGTAIEAQVLTGSDGTWTGSPTSYTRQWRRCDSGGWSCVDITGATGSSYTLVAADGGSTIRFAVTATNAGGSTTASSAATAVVKRPPLNTAPPTVSGATTEAWTLTTNEGTWANTPTSYSYQWRQCDTAGQNCTDITGATSSSYVISADDVGHVLRAVVTASNADGPTSVASAATSSVGALVTVAAPDPTLETQTTQTYNGPYVEAVRWQSTGDGAYELTYQRRTYDEWAGAVVYPCVAYTTWPRNTCGDDGIGYDGRTYGFKSFRQELWNEFGVSSKTPGDLVPQSGDCGDLTGTDAPTHNPCFSWRWYDGQDVGPVSIDQSPSVGSSPEMAPVAPVAASPNGVADPATYTSETWAPEETDTNKQLAVIASTAAGTTAVTGLVTDEATGDPISGAAVAMNYLDGSGVERSVSTTSGALGGYAFVNMPPATYTVSFAAAGHGTLTFTNDSYEADQTYELTAPLSTEAETYDATTGPETDNDVTPDWPPTAGTAFSYVLPPPSIRIAVLPIIPRNDPLVIQNSKYACGADRKYNASVDPIQTHSMFYYLARVAYEEIRGESYNGVALDAFSSISGNFAWYHVTQPATFDVMNTGGLPRPNEGAVGRYSFQCYGPKKGGKVLRKLRDNIVAAMKWHFAGTVAGHASPIYETHFARGSAGLCTNGWWANNPTPPGQASQLGMGPLAADLGCLGNPSTGDMRSPWQRVVSVYYPPCAGPYGCFRKNASAPTPKVWITSATAADGSATKVLHFESRAKDQTGVSKLVGWHYIVRKYYVDATDGHPAGWSTFKVFPYNGNKLEISSCGAYQVQGMNPAGGSAWTQFIPRTQDPKTPICP
jgi:hypothetical protein